MEDSRAAECFANEPRRLVKMRNSSQTPVVQNSLGIGKLKNWSYCFVIWPGTSCLTLRTGRLKTTITIHECLMDTNQEVNLVTPENNQKAFDADKAEAFSEKLLTALNL